MRRNSIISVGIRTHSILRNMLDLTRRLSNTHNTKQITRQR
jgi:hypothetical protein